MRKSLFVVAVAVSALFVACGGDEGEELLKVDSELVTADLQRQLDAHIVGAASAGSFMESSTLVDELFPVEEGETSVPTPFPGGGGGGMRDDAQQMADFLKQHIFVASNIETSDATSVTYLVNPDGICDADPECIDFFTDVPLRVVVTSPAEGAYKAKLLVGTAKLKPADFEISDTKLAAEVDLGDAKAVVEMIAKRGGEEAALPRVMNGRIRAELVKNDEADYSMVYGVLEAVTVEYAGQAASFGVASEAVTLHVVGGDRLLEVVAKLGAVALSVPGELLQTSGETCEVDSSGNRNCWEVESSGPTGGVFAFVAPGMSGSASFNGATEVLTLSDISVGNGPATLEVDGQDLISVELNPNAGHSFSATLSMVGGKLQIAVQPSFELVARMTLQNLLAYFDDTTEIESWSLDETLRIALSDGGVVEMLGDAVKVISGTLTISSKDYDVSVAAGQCAIDGSTGEETHPMAAMSAGECPVPTPDPLP